MFDTLWNLTWILMKGGFYLVITGLFLVIDYKIIRVILKCFGVDIPKHPIKEMRKKKEEANKKVEEAKVEIVDLSDEAK